MFQYFINTSHEQGYLLYSVYKKYSPHHINLLILVIVVSSYKMEKNDKNLFLCGFEQV